jgi:short-subunit dehydrogenase
MSKTIVITGASRGIGFELVKLAEKKEYKVYALSRNTKNLDSTNFVNPISIDITDEILLSNFILELKKNDVTIDALINNAGAFLNKPFSDTTKSEFEAIYQVNLFGLASITRMLLPQISTKGHVINISSMGGIDGSVKFPGLSAYSSSKGAVNILTELLAEEYKETGPSFNALALGAVQTEMLEEAFPGLKAPLSAKKMASYVLDFAITGQKYYNGKILPISSSTP